MPKVVKNRKMDVPDRVITDRKVIHEPRCKVCTSEVRAEIDGWLVRGFSYLGLSKRLKAAGYDISDKSLERHAKRHLDIDKSAYRTIFDQNVKEMGEAQARGELRVVSGQAWLDMFIQQATDILIKGELEVEAKDVIKAIELREAFRRDGISIMEERFMLEVQAIAQAIKELLPPDKYIQIVHRAREISSRRTLELESGEEDIEEAEIVYD